MHLHHDMIGGSHDHEHAHPHDHDHLHGEGHTPDCRGTIFAIMVQITIPALRLIIRLLHSLQYH